MILLDDKHKCLSYTDGYNVDYVVAGSIAQFPTSATRQTSDMKEAPILIGDDLLVQAAPVYQHVPAIKQNSGMRKTPALRRSTRVVPKLTSKIIKSSQKQYLTKSNIKDKAAQLLDILRSKGEGAKIEKPSLTPQ